jgi:hypothetical protein
MARPAKGKTWKHPRFGKFTGVKLPSGDGPGICWSAQVELPAFRKLKYVQFRSRRTPPPPTSYPLSIWRGEQLDKPPSAAIDLMTRLVDRQKEIVQVIANAFWDEFNGKGPNSRNWWYGALKKKSTQWILEDCPLSGPKDILASLNLESVLIQNVMDGYDGFIIHLWMHSGFEVEHGIGVLTDGHNILGTGYMMEVAPYGYTYSKKPKRKVRK